METLPKPSEINKPRLARELYDRDSLELRAWQLIQNRERVEHDSWQQEPQINARTAIFEELTAKGHLSHVEFNEPPDVINQRTLQRLLNGWTEQLPKWEQERRFLEIVEELTIHEVWEDVKAGRLPSDTIVITISNFPEQAPETEATQIGYGVLNRKGMVRSTDFQKGTRRVEQVSRSNSNDQSSALLFKVNELSDAPNSSAFFLANQIITTKRVLPDGVVDIQRALDGFAGPNIMYGEDLRRSDTKVPAYAELRQVSRAREAQAIGFIMRLADLERELNISYKDGLITYGQKLSRLNHERRTIVNEICLLDPTYAKDARGAASVAHFEMASVAMAAGNDAAGTQHLANALAKADPRAGAVCGGDGPERLFRTSEEVGQIYLEAKNERKSWKWKKGVCVIKECPTRPAKVEVGPCSVCRRCQRIFDNGEKPKAVYKTIGFLDILFESVREFNLKYDRQKTAKVPQQK